MWIHTVPSHLVSVPAHSGQASCKHGCHARVFLLSAKTLRLLNKSFSYSSLFILASCQSLGPLALAQAPAEQFVGGYVHAFAAIRGVVDRVRYPHGVFRLPGPLRPRQPLLNPMIKPLWRDIQIPCQLAQADDFNCCFEWIAHSNSYDVSISIEKYILHCKFILVYLVVTGGTRLW